MNRSVSPYPGFGFFGRLFEQLRVMVLRARGCQIGRGVEVSWGVTVRGPGAIEIGNHVRIREGVILQSSDEILIEDHVDINPFTTIYGRARIGSYTMIAPHVMLAGGNHKFDDPTILIKHQGSTALGIVVEEDVWIGANAVILDGVRIGKGAVVGAGAVVTKDVPSNVIVVGNPARIIHHRGASQVGISPANAD